MDKRNFAVFIDLENAGGKVETLNSVIEKVKIQGDILLGKVYGYSERYSDLKEVLLSNTFNVVPSLRFGSNQKNNLDILLVIDALEVAYTNPLIDCFCIVSGDSDYTPLVGRLKTMGKFVLGISRSEVASSIFIKACSEFMFLESVQARSKPKRRQRNGSEDTIFNSEAELVELIEKILNEQGDDEGSMYASELKNTIARLRPDFNEKNFGFSSFGKLLGHLAQKHASIETADNRGLRVYRLAAEGVTAQLTKENWQPIFEQTLKKIKADGFSRVNPSVIKSAITADYPDYEERKIGFRKFSDVLKDLEKQGLLRIAMTEDNSMLVDIQ